MKKLFNHPLFFLILGIFSLIAGVIIFVNGEEHKRLGYIGLAFVFLSFAIGGYGENRINERRYYISAAMLILLGTIFFVIDGYSDFSILFNKN